MRMLGPCPLDAWSCFVKISWLSSYPGSKSDPGLTRNTVVPRFYSRSTHIRNGPKRILKHSSGRHVSREDHASHVHPTKTPVRHRSLQLLSLGLPSLGPEHRPARHGNALRLSSPFGKVFLAARRDGASKTTAAPSCAARRKAAHRFIGLEKPEPLFSSSNSTLVPEWQNIGNCEIQVPRQTVAKNNM